MIRISLASFLVSVLFMASCAGPIRRVDMKMPYEDRLRLASIYIQNDQPERAVPLLEDASVQNPGRPEAYAVLGEVLFLKGDLEGSARSLTRALETGGDDPVILNNLAWVEMGRGDAEKALSLTDRALRVNPVPLYPYLDTRARVLLELGRPQEALEEAATALELLPDYDNRMRDRLEELVRELRGKTQGEEEIQY